MANGTVVCTTFSELLEVVAQLVSDSKSKDYDLGRTNRFYLVPEDGHLPLVKGGTKKWMSLGRTKNSKPMVDLMVDRRWVTITISDDGEDRMQHFQCIRSKHPVEVLRDIFEWKKSYGWAENLSLSFLLL